MTTRLALLAAPLALGVGDARFWNGDTIRSGDVARTELCDVQAPCPSWPLDVASGGERLRVAIDTPSREDGFRIDLVAPDGKVTSASASNQFNGEAFVARPAAGRWTVRVVPRGATDAWFRMRAKLEGATARAPGDRVLLPNLRSVPPYEMGFVAPANPFNGVYPPDTVNPPLSAAGQEPLSCAADEAAPAAAGGADAKDCLRLTSGPINVGEGPFVKTFTFADDLASGAAALPLLRGPAFQTLYRADGTTTKRPAGTYSFHTTHGHFHDDGILTYELFRVEDGTLTPAGAGTKSGFCPADQLFGEWRSFTQAPAGDFGEGDSPTGNCFSPTDGTLALTVGWGDVYRWQRPGQFVEFAGNEDGHFVVRTTVDKGDTTLESDERDNSAYAHVRVTGRTVAVLERGQGTSHLDPAKVVFTGHGPASQDAQGGELPVRRRGGAPTAPATAPASGAAPTGGATPTEATRPAGNAASTDRRAPRVRRVRVVGGVLRFTLDEPATAVVSVRRRGRTVRRLTVRARRGANRVRLGRLRAGRILVAIAARDAAGNHARPVRATARIRRR